MAVMAAPSMITETPATMLASIRNPGAMGEPTLPVRDDHVAQDGMHLRLEIYEDMVVAYKDSTPNWTVEGRHGQFGRDVPGRAEQPPPHLKDKYVAWGPGSFVDQQNRPYEARGNKGQRGTAERTQRSDLSWAHPGAMAAVRSYARTAFRNGFRDAAARALAPYYVASLRTDAVGRCSAEARMAFASMVALYNNLDLNLDYYGNPPGWVPRPNALSNLSVLKTVREAAYATYYFAERMLADAEAQQDLRATAVETSAALGAEMKAAREQVQKAYTALPAAMTKLNTVQKLVVGAEAEILRLRQEAIARSVDKAMLARFVTAALQLVDGVAKSLPVGQPFVGLGGSVFGAAAKVDWTAEKPLSTAGKAIDHLSEQVTTFVTQKSDMVASAVTRGLGEQASTAEALVTKLTRQQEDVAEEPAKAVAAVEVKWQDAKSKELLGVEEQIKKTTEAITEIKGAAKDEGDADVVVANDFLAALNKQKDLLTTKRVGTLQKELVEYRRQQFTLIDQAQKAAKVKNALLKKEAGKTPTADLPPSVAQQLVAATRQSEDLKTKIAAKEATAKETMSQLENLGTGLAMVGNAIMTMASCW
jgi:hypothetical protein